MICNYVQQSQKRMLIVILIWTTINSHLNAANVPPEYAWKSDSGEYAGLAEVVANLASNYINYQT